MFQKITYSFDTSLSPHEIQARLRTAGFDADASFFDTVEGSRLALRSFGQRLYIVRSRSALSWTDSEWLKARAWCRVVIQEGRVTFNFGSPWLQRLGVVLLPPILLLVLFGFAMAFDSAVLLMVMVASVAGVLTLVPAITQTQLAVDREKILEWAKAILDLSPRSSMAAGPTGAGVAAPVGGKLEGLDVGAAMAKDYESPFWKRVGIGAAVIAALWLASGLLESVLPLIAHLVPVRVETLWGCSIVRNSPDVIQDPLINQTLQVIGQRLLAAAPNQPYHFTFEMRRSKTQNAFAVPGGRVVILSGLVPTLESPEELEGVMAHEMEHVLQRHSLQRLLRAKIMGLLGHAAYRYTGTNAGFADAFAGLKFSRHDEAQADLKGLDLLAAARLDPRGLVTFFGRSAEPSGGALAALSEFNSSHPSDAHRTQRLSEHLKTLPVGTADPLSVPWREFVARSKKETEKL